MKDDWSADPPKDDVKKDDGVEDSTGDTGYVERNAVGSAEADRRKHDSRHPIEGTAFLVAAALASVPAARLPDLLTRVQTELGPRIGEYRRRYERIASEHTRETFLVEPDHWTDIGDQIGLTSRERKAVARAHEAAVKRIGTSHIQRSEFESALEIRSGVVIGKAMQSRDPDCRDPPD